MKNKEQLVRVRIAPSPTGFMHIGTLRTALTNYLFARQNQGNFILRLEDTDQTRYVKGATENLIKSLKWAGLNWDEGVFLNEQDKIVEKGEYGPYIQSKRLKIYREYIQKLIKVKKAYPCFCSSERLNEIRKIQQKKGQARMYDRTCLKLSKEEIEEKLKNKEKHVIRLKMPNEGVTGFKDMIRKEVKIENKLIDDQVLIKSDGFPTYHFAVVVDDYLMKISHIFRGEEWLPSTPKHIVLFKYFKEIIDPDLIIPRFGHIPLMLSVNGGKLSKRHGDVSLRDFRKKGYLPEALINFIALIGWNPKTTQEIFSMQELIDQFDVKKINKAGAKFDYKRLDWFGAYYIKQLSINELYKKTKKYFKKANIEEEKAKKIIKIQQERISKLSDILADLDYLFKPTEKLDYDKALLFWKEMNKDEVKENLEKAKRVVNQDIEDENQDSQDGLDLDFNDLDKIQAVLLEAAGDKRGEFLWPLRVALTGEKQSISPFEAVWVLGKEESLKRIDWAIENMASF
jgi:nondiscriminating glutamyl-tRNA synthetase